MLFPKFRYWRSKPYRMWVASLPCCACGIEGWGQCAHSNQAKHGKGGGVKASDEFSFCLCSTRPGHQGCHTVHDTLVDMTHEQRSAIEDDYIARTQAMAAREGMRLAA